MEIASGYTANPSRSLKRMKKMYEENWEPPGLREIKGFLPFTGYANSVFISIEDESFERHEIALIHTGNEWKIDWESTVGWSELPWAEMKKLKPAQPTLIRAYVRKSDYHNFDFEDDDKWSAFQLGNYNQEQTLYGYVPANGSMDTKLQPLSDQEVLKFLLRVRYLENSLSSNQVVIDEVIAEGWTQPEEDP